MRFAVIRPAERAVIPIETNEFRTAVGRAGLPWTKTDHGRVSRYVCIVVDEFSLMKPPDEQLYYAFGRKLFGGNALLYAIGDHGETVPLTAAPIPHFFECAADVEAAIAAGTIDRPRVRVNGVIVWEWPQPS